jgi:hypothetical protein
MNTASLALSEGKKYGKLRSSRNITQLILPELLFGSRPITLAASSATPLKTRISSKNCIMTCKAKAYVVGMPQ